MKYVITDQGDVAIGGKLHKELATPLQGSVVAAGECERLEDGWTVFGQSFGLNIKAKNSDRFILDAFKKT